MLLSNVTQRRDDAEEVSGWSSPLLVEGPPDTIVAISSRTALSVDGEVYAVACESAERIVTERVDGLSSARSRCFRAAVRLGHGPVRRLRSDLQIVGFLQGPDGIAGIATSYSPTLAMTSSGQVYARVRGRGDVECWYDPVRIALP